MASGPGTRMRAKQDLKRCKETQEHWNDDEFLAVTANAFMKLRWKRLNRRCAAAVSESSHILGRPLDLVDVGCAHADFYGYAKDSLSSYCGVEPSKALLPRNQGRGKAWRLVRGKAGKLPLQPSCAALVLGQVG